MEELHDCSFSMVIFNFAFSRFFVIDYYVYIFFNKVLFATKLDKTHVHVGSR